MISTLFEFILTDNQFPASRIGEGKPVFLTLVNGLQLAGDLTRGPIEGIFTIRAVATVGDPSNPRAGKPVTLNTYVDPETVMIVNTQAEETRIVAPTINFPGLKLT